MSAEKVLILVHYINESFKLAASLGISSQELVQLQANRGGNLTSADVNKLLSELEQAKQKAHELL